MRCNTRRTRLLNRRQITTKACKIMIACLPVTTKNNLLPNLRRIDCRNQEMFRCSHFVGSRKQITLSTLSNANQ